MPKKFIRNIEDFTCDHCKTKVTGDGYTNHCPHCLWSKHVDVNPGDRAERCGGMMKPTDFMIERGKYIIVHRCETCGFERRNKIEGGDDFDEVLRLAKSRTRKYMDF